jgi:hypothetical protein
VVGKYDYFSFLHTQITSFSNYFSGDPYVGDNRAEIKKKNERIAELEKEVKRLRSESDRNSFSRSRDHARAESGEDKKRRSVLIIFDYQSRREIAQ